jgi:hypothetical protein
MIRTSSQSKSRAIARLFFFIIKVYLCKTFIVIPEKLS